MIASGSVAMMITTVVELHFPQEVLIILAGIVLGVMLPIVRLNALIRSRHKQIRRSLPEFLDLLCVSVQAGLSFHVVGYSS